jgi:hypothetical protein
VPSTIPSVPGEAERILRQPVSVSMGGNSRYARVRGLVGDLRRVIRVDQLSQASTEADGAVLVPVDMGGQIVYLSVREMNGGLPGGRDEREIADRRPRLEGVLTGVANFAKQVVGTLQETGASKVSVEFGCEFALEAGAFVAVIGKVSSKSTLTVGLEWAKPES